MFGSNPFGQSSSSPFGAQPVFGQPSNSTSNPFAPKPFGSTSPFGAQTGGSIFGSISTGVFGAQSSSALGSTSVFGASSSPAFGSSTPTFGASTGSAFGNASSAFGGSSAFGQKPAFGGFGSSTTQTSPFGSSFQQSQPAFGSNLFGSSTPFGAPSQPAFGSSSTPAFGASSTPAFGSTSTPAFGSTATPAFGSTGGAFGVSTSPFGSSTPAFGASSTPAFGASSTPAFGATSTPAFGATSTPAFGATTTPAFGASSTPSFNFGSSPAFGQSGSTFGSSPFGATSTFGAQSSSFGTQTMTPTFGSPGFGGKRGGSRVSPYSSTPETDAGSQPAGKLESISAMPVYKDKSHEELRWEDYQLGDKGGPAPTGQATATPGFGSSGFGSTTTAFGPSSANPFSSSSASNPFAPKTPVFSGTGFGSSSTPAFGSSPFGTANTPNPFGSTTSATTPSPFGATTPAFGVNTSPSPFSSSTSAFGSPSIFGSTSAPGTGSAFGTGLGFGNTQSSPLFQSTTSTLAQTISPFGQTSSAFGQTAPAFGQPNLFSTPSTGFGGNSFSNTSSLLSGSNTLGLGQTTPSLATPFQPAQPAQSSGGFSFSNFGQSHPAAAPAGGFGGTPGAFNSSTFGQLYGICDAGWTPDPVNNTGLSATLITTLIKEASVDKYVADVHPEVDEAARTSIQAKFGISPVVVKDMIEAIPAVTPSNPKATGSIDLLDITPLPVMFNTPNQPSTQQPEALEVQPLHEQSDPGLDEQETKAVGDADDSVKEQVDADSGLDELPTSRLYDRISEIMNIDINQAMEHLGELEMLFGHLIAEEESSGDEIRGLLVDTGLISANYSASDHHALTEKKHKEAMNHLDAERELLAELRHLQSASATLDSFGDKLMLRLMELDFEKLVVHDGLESVATDMIGLSHDIDNARSRELASHGKQRKRLLYQHEVAKSHSILAARFRKEAEQGWQRLMASWSKLSNNPTT